MNRIATTDKTSRAVTSLLVFESGLTNTGTEKRVSQQSVYETVWDGISISYSLGWLIDEIGKN